MDIHEGKEDAASHRRGSKTFRDEVSYKGDKQPIAPCPATPTLGVHALG
jgi:hypothetical protein